MINRVWLENNMDLLKRLKAGSVDLIYIDPPYNTGKRQKRGKNQYEDRFSDFMEFIGPRLRQCKRVLKSTGTLFVHLDWREVHYVKVYLDGLLGRDHFLNEIIWSYDYGGRSKRKWSNKHDSILCYVMDPKRYTYNYDQIDRIPYMAPKLVGPKKAAKGKTPTDVWWNTIVSPTGNEKTGYPTQKPLKIIERIVKVHSNPGDVCFDFFAGSGTLGEAAAKNGRVFWLCDENPQAVEVIHNRLSEYL